MSRHQFTTRESLFAHSVVCHGNPLYDLSDGAAASSYVFGTVVKKKLNLPGADGLARPIPSLEFLTAPVSNLTTLLHNGAASGDDSAQKAPHREIGATAS